MAWTARQLMALPRNRATVLLIGGCTVLEFRLRVAQSHIRHDLSPSAWSHAALLEASATSSLAEAKLHEIRLDRRGAGWFDPAANAIQVGRLAAYSDVKEYPNIALLVLPVGAGPVLERLERLGWQRSLLDCMELVVKWLAYAWGVGGAPNPLLEGSGIPSAALVESAVAATGFDLTPGLASRASCPEAMWQAAKWWYPYHGQEPPPPDTPAGTPARRKRAGRPARRAAADKPVIRGAWCVTHRLTA